MPEMCGGMPTGGAEVLKKTETLALNYKRVKFACYLGFITQAIVNNFLPLLFLTLQRDFDVSLEQISLLVSVNFGVQLLTDLTSPLYVDKLGYWPSMRLAHILCAVGLAGLCFFTELFSEPFYGVMTAVVIYAIGGGLLEVLVSPIVDACPSKNKEAEMSLLHSFYCWGHVGVVLTSTAFFALFGLENWRIMACIWALLPLYNLYNFCTTSAPDIVEKRDGMRVGELVKKGVFWRMFVMMLCAGASEQGMSQWASAFAESSLGVSKTVGDLLGPCGFAVMMGLSRMYFGRYGEKMDLRKFMNLSSVLCVCSYLLATLTSAPWLGLAGCMLCGLSVGIMWPGSFSTASGSIANGGTVMFAFLALAGDVGCASGPALVGYAADKAGGDLKRGLLLAIVFPVVLLACNIVQSKRSLRESAH